MTYGGTLFAAYWAWHAEYVRDGLELWLDGIENTRNGHSANPTAWEDLSGNGYDFAPYSSGGGNMPTAGDKYFTGFSSSVFLVNSSQALQGLGELGRSGTLEAVYMANSSHNGQIFGFRNISGTGRSLAKLCVKNNANLIVAGRYSNTAAARYVANGVGYAVGVPVHCSLAYGGTAATIDAEVDGVDYATTAGDTGWGNNGANCVGARWSTGSTNFYPFDGRIYCIRYYSRILTDAERAHNRAVDLRRFG